MHKLPRFLCAPPERLFDVPRGTLASAQLPCALPRTGRTACRETALRAPRAPHGRLSLPCRTVSP